MIQIDFKIVNGQKVKTANELLTRLGKILDENEVPYDKKVLAELIQKYYLWLKKKVKGRSQKSSPNGDDWSKGITVVRWRERVVLFLFWLWRSARTGSEVLS